MSVIRGYLNSSCLKYISDSHWRNFSKHFYVFSIVENNLIYLMFLYLHDCEEKGVFLCKILYNDLNNSP